MSMDIYQQYVEIQQEINRLEDIKESLRARMEKDLPEDGFKNEKITVYWTTKRSWNYSPKVEGLTAELRATKKLEEEEGIAKLEETKQIAIKVK